MLWVSPFPIRLFQIVFRFSFDATGAKEKLTKENAVVCFALASATNAPRVGWRSLLKKRRKTFPKGSPQHPHKSKFEKIFIHLLTYRKVCDIMTKQKEKKMEFDAWRGFKGQDWKENINVSNFIDCNYIRQSCRTGTA